MKKLVLGLLTVFGLISCGLENETNQKSEVETTQKVEIKKLDLLKVKHYTCSGICGNVKTDSIIESLNGKYINLTAKELVGGGYNISHDLVDVESCDNFNMEFIRLVDEYEKTIEFKSETDFLNYIDNFGYSVYSRIVKKYSIDYVFKLE